jgi:protein involved in polysaccharide export with SLBB domain
MHKKALLLICFATVVFAQTSLSDLRNLSNSELDRIKSELMNDQMKETPQSSAEDFILPSPDVVSLQNTNNQTSDYFGYDYFNREISFFDNTPVPSNYRLGPGDEIILSMWGETNQRKSLTIDKNGQIYFEDIGFVNISNMILSEAEKYLAEELSTIYATLKDQDRSTGLSLSLGNLKSINVYFSGHIENPGINLVHPFSDIFSAIVQAGGIDENGSLREVQLIRNNQIITTVDFYSFFINGKSTFSNIKLIDGDTIHIPSFKNRVSISGEVNRPTTYELLDSETLSSIITYASGLTSNASSTIILNQIIPVEERLSDDNAKNNIALNFKNSHSKALNNGDSVKVLSIADVDLNVEVFGRVKSPGNYPADNSLKYILDIAGGFDDPVFRQTIREDAITILRKDSNKFYATEFVVDYKNAENFLLEKNDKIFVYEDVNYRNSFTYRVEGEVNKPGTFPFKSGLTVEDAIKISGGLTELSSNSNIVIYQEFTELQEDGTKLTKTREVANADLDFVLGSNSIIKALPYENVIRVEGNVYNPGLVAYDRGLTMAQAIVLAGGYKPYSMKKRAFVKRANGEVSKANLFRGRGKRLFPGDTVVVPVNPNPSDFDITSFIADLSSTLANLAAILLIVENNKN